MNPEDRPNRYSLEDFAETVDIHHPLTTRRLPVIADRPRWKFHVALVIGGPDYFPKEHHGLTPEDFEIEQLLVYLEKTMRYYNDRYRKIVENRAPFDVDGTVNTATFRKSEAFGWQYNRWSWTRGVPWAPSNPASHMILEQLLDHIETYGLSDGPSEKWKALKAESGKFESQEIS